MRTPLAPSSRATRNHPSVRSKWKAEQAVRLQAIDGENLKADEAIKAAAKTELEAIVAEVTKAQESRAAANKEAEAAWVEQRDNPKPGSEWQNVMHYIDEAKDAPKGVRDVARLRTILIQLKNEGLKR